MPANLEMKEKPVYAGFAEIDPAKNHLILVGDTQGTSQWEFWRERNDRERRLIVDEIARQDPAFAVNLGDLTTQGSSAKHWQEFDDLHAALREKRIPYLPILGNHDVYGNNQSALQNFFSRFPHLSQQRWYSFTWKNVVFVMVDSNFSMMTEEQKKERAKWYLDGLERLERDGSVDHIIVCCHRPPFTNSRVVKPDGEVQRSFADPFVRFRKTRIFFSGHAHTYERFQSEGKFFIVSGGGGGPRQKVQIDDRKRRYEDLFSGPELRFFHFCRIEARDGSLYFSVHRLGSDSTFSIAESFTIPDFGTP
jgi:3',5'-cyclic AMP phosphodiesterase CpdA